MSTTIHMAILKDHQQIESYYAQYTQAKGDAEAQAHLSTLLSWEIARHAVGEEIVIHPLMEKHLGSMGEQMVAHDREDHQALKKKLRELQSLAPDSRGHAAAIQNIMNQLTLHMRAEEQKDLPLIESVIGHDQSKIAAEKFNKTKLFVPTSASNKAPYTTLVGFLDESVDKLAAYLATLPGQDTRHGMN